MSAEASVLVFEAVDADTYVTTVRQFLCENGSANTVKLALSHRDLKPMGTLEWRLAQPIIENIEVMSRIIAGFIMTQPHGSVTISARADRALKRSSPESLSILGIGVHSPQARPARLACPASDWWSDK